MMINLDLEDHLPGDTYIYTANSGEKRLWMIYSLDNEFYYPSYNILWMDTGEYRSIYSTSLKVMIGKSIKLGASNEQKVT